MPLFKKSKKVKGDKNVQYGSAYLPNGQNPQQQQIGQRNASGNEDASLATKPFKYAPNLSKTMINVGGLPVSVFGIDELTPAPSRALAPIPPELCIAIHMHGRGGSADNEEKIVRQIWDRVERSKRQYSQDYRTNEFLIVSFDARNHGHRLTNEVGQKGWKQENRSHAIDLYSMILGTAQDVSHLVDFLPSYLFPFDERKVTKFAVTGKSLGGHAVWHVLQNDARIQIGVPFISCPDFAKLMKHRAPKSFVSYSPPYVPASLQSLISQVDPASRPFDQADPSNNPFWGKQICVCSGREDRLVPWSCAEPFVQRLVVGPPHEQKRNYRVVLEEGIGHEVTESMIEEAGHWIFLHGIAV